jgi:hypothetical protein
MAFVWISDTSLAALLVFLVISPFAAMAVGVIRRNKELLTGIFVGYRRPGRPRRLESVPEEC